MTLSDGTVKVYLSRLFQKVGVKDRFELALFAIKNLFDDPPEPKPACVAGESGPQPQPSPPLLLSNFVTVERPADRAK